MKTQTLHFQVQGEFLTQHCRELWVEGRLSLAFETMKSSGCPEKFHVEVLTGNLKMEGINELHLEKDDTTKKYGISLGLKESIKRFEKQLISAKIKFTSAERRYKYWPLRMDFQGVCYKRNNWSSEVSSTIRVDKEVMKTQSRIIGELEPLITKLYSLIGKSVEDFPDELVMEAIDKLGEEIDINHPNYMPNMSGRVRSGETFPFKKVEKMYEEQEELIEKRWKKKSNIVFTENPTVIEKVAERNNLGKDRVVTNPYPKYDWISNIGNVEDYEIPDNFKFPFTFGEGIVIVDHNDLYESKKANSPREVILNIRSWRGISIGAIHYYGDLSFWGIGFTKNGNFESESSSTGFPRVSQSISINLKRKLTKQEIETQKDRWTGYREGDFISNFNTIKDLEYRAGEVFKKSFGPFWKLKIEKSWE